MATGTMHFSKDALRLSWQRHSWGGYLLFIMLSLRSAGESEAGVRGVFAAARALAPAVVSHCPYNV